MGLVSSVYGLAPSAFYVVSRDEVESRVRGKMKRLVDVFGQEEVVHRIRAYRTDGIVDGFLKAWLVMKAEVTVGSRSGTF